MKTKLIILISLILFSFISSSNAQQSKYEEQMLKQIEKMKQASTHEELKSSGAIFKRIALIEPSRWESYYYASLCEINATFWSNNFTDNLADEVDILIEKAFELNGDESELYCLQSQLSTIRMMVNPQDRYMSEGPKGKQILEKAVEANPENPRAFLLFGESIFHTPEQFGGGKEKAMPYIKKSLALYESFKSDNSLHPRWGLERAEWYMKMTSENPQ